MSERKVLRARTALNEQIDCVVAAMEIAEPYLAPELVDRAAEVLSRAESRRKLSAEHVVVGLFGATGSGKSSLFNAIVNQDIARTGVIRPTTTKTVAALWKAEGAEEILDWLQVDQRHILQANPDTQRRDASDSYAGGLILLDLPDMDSTSIEHHEISARLAGQVDYLVWVLDPQKYADASVHHRYLTELTAQYGNILVVMNQIDLIGPKDRAIIQKSLNGILAVEGLAELPIESVSAHTGEGIDALRQRIHKVAENKALATRRLKSDVDSVIRLMEGELSVTKARVPSSSEQAELERVIALSHGAQRIAQAVQVSYRLRAANSTGWPVTSWLVRLRNDPLKRMSLGRSEESSSLSLTSRPDLSVAESAAISHAVNGYLVQASQDLPQGWTDPLREEITQNTGTMEPEIDRAIAETNLGVARKSWWWPITKSLQWISLAFSLIGALWLVGIAMAGYFQFQLPPTPRVEGIAIPTLMVFTGILLGIVLGLLGSFVNRMVAKMKSRKALKNLEYAISGVVRQNIVAPVTYHLDRYNSYAVLISGAAKKAE